MDIVQDYGLRFYVRDMYPKLAPQRGGECFRPFYKKDIKPYQIMVKCAINRSAKVLELIAEKYPIQNN